jgi:ABC-type sugar transport system ATPase subunit
LSGGNQQKVVLARWIDRDLRVLIADEPTRGVDVGAKASIHRHIEALADGGCAILLVSSDLPEVLRLSHRIFVMRQGRIVADLSATGATSDRILRLMAGVY